MVHILGQTPPDKPKHQDSGGGESVNWSRQTNRRQDKKRYDGRADDRAQALSRREQGNGRRARRIGRAVGQIGLGG